MNNNQIRNIEGYETFKTDCKFFKCEEEYPGWTGKEKYGIITALTEEEFKDKYPQFAIAMSPYILLGPSFGEIRDESIRNNHKYEMRAKRTISIFEMDEEAERRNPELSVPDYFTEKIEKQEEEARRRELTDMCRVALSKLTTKQQENLVDYYINKKSMQQIADERHCSKATIGVSIVNAKDKFLKAYKNMLTNGTPLYMHYEGVDSILNRISASNNKNESNEEN